MDKYMMTVPNSISDNVCNRLIELFESNNLKKKGLIGLSQYDPNIKDTVDLLICAQNTQGAEWTYLENVLYNSVCDAMKMYPKHLEQHAHQIFLLDSFNEYQFHDTGYQIQKYSRGKGHYTWHHDYQINVKRQICRYITFMWYLNDVEEGGETEFVDGTKIKPKKGTLLCFPACRTFHHKANVPLSSDKYICTGWIYGQLI